jgi:uncharacterized protein
VVSSSGELPVLYEVEVAHERRSPLQHGFTYRASYWLVDFDRLPQLRGLARWLVRISRTDHLDIRHLLDEKGISASRIVMLTGARTLGYAFNPLTVYWCYDASGVVRALVAEVHNTYGDRHGYVLEPNAEGETRVDKALYVSPFNSVDGIYRIRADLLGSAVSVSVTLERQGEEPFVATLQGRRQPMRPRTIIRSALRHSGARTRVLIHWQGLRLWLRGLKVQPR